MDEQQSKFIWRLGEILIQNGWVKWEHLMMALEIQDRMSQGQTGSLLSANANEAPSIKGLNLGELLVRSGALSWENLEQVLSEQKKSGRMLGEICLERKYVKEKDLYRALAQQAGFSFVSLDQIAISKHLADLLPKEFVYEHEIIPIVQRNEELLVVLHDFHNLDHETEMRKLLPNFKIVIAVAAPSDIKAALIKYYGDR